MANGKNRLFWLTSLAIASIPLAVTFYGVYSDRRWLTIFSFVVFLICLLLSTCTFVSWKTFKFSTPIILQILRGISYALSPLANILRSIPVLGNVVNGSIKLVFWSWFVILMFSDVLVRKLLKGFVGLHEPSAGQYSTVNAYRPRYSQPIATTLAMVAKLVYEDVPIIRHELARSGYDLNSFRAIAYKNTCGFIVQKGRNIVLVFRGTDPLNLQNAWTDLQSRLVPIQTLQDPPVPLGKCHQGMYNALGKADDFLLPSEQLAQQQREESRRATRTNTVNLELSSQSVYQTVATSIRAAYILVKFLVVGLFTHVADPVDYRFAGEIRDLGAFAQACRWIGNSILDIYNNQYRNEQDGDYKRKKLRFYICGHSLGGALATIFLAKMVQSNSPLLDIFSGLYTFGCPRLGDKDFSHAFGSRLACKMFHHTPPGTLVFIDSSRTITLYPPDPHTLMPVPVRGISFMHLSGILNVRVIMRMRRESWLRILERIVLPFFMNDHFPGDYVKALAEGKIEIVVQ
ncbi:MAG: Alpha/Beta hydrolase protein, partial [Linnemannia gamsii]